ncbi:RNA-directed RNA polymerase [Aspergillus heteromorphus CBS 117.55]|uniref:RNA-dependent RNA polymerase n=1 Tax=Aspergillus heteromorphus CBS 117.55 TaxID=1448321 RepID=A0A317WY10_9EURO|nr:RNA-directed RNA polymerase [Aspergillus heteromorphus CBS 117.55]PWY90801.1 RNA-directed RNA polymerase [Aspergillus heteromorphus CBS 117.55]
MVAVPRTPVRSGPELSQLIDSINDEFGLDIPNPRLYSPSVGRNDKSLAWRSYRGIQRLYFDRNVDLNQILNNLEEWVLSHSTTRGHGINHWGHVPGSFASLSGRNERGHTILSLYEKEERLRYLVRLIEDEVYLLNKGSFTAFREEDEHELQDEHPEVPSATTTRSLKRRLSVEEEEFHTAPNSPVKDPDRPDNVAIAIGPEQFYDLGIRGPNGGMVDLQPTTAASVHIFKSPKKPDTAQKPSRFVERLTAPDNVRLFDAVQPAQDSANFSFSTTVPAFSSGFLSSRNGPYNTSFTSTVTDPIMDNESMYGESVVGHMMSDEMRTTFDQQTLPSYIQEPRYSLEGEIMGELLHNGPFTLDQEFPSSVPLRYRYEMERVARTWDIPLDRILRGTTISFKALDDFWQWIAGHNQRDGKRLPEKPSRKAWDAAIGNFKTSNHSEAVVLTGELEWCAESEPGILKMKLNPLKTERTCRFHRRFGSDRFLSLTIPAPARPPPHLRLTSQPTLLRESLALWLTQNVHRCLGRMWKPFFVEEVKSKRKIKSEPKFRVDFFAIDGIDFDHGVRPVPPIAPHGQESGNHTPMSLDALIDWHMPSEANRGQSNCKLFQRFSLGLSKTFATVVLKPRQVFPLPDDPDSPVMNDGCALMSRAMANQICDSLGLTGNTPSSFQGRIAGAKGLWMVDRHQSHISAGGDNIWIQISDSQLKIKPHPHEWRGLVDDEQLTFEVVKWSKPLHPVDLNTQLLAILDHGGHVKEHIADLTRLGIQGVYRDFEEVLRSDSPVLCRSLIQKIRPSADDGFGLMSQKARRFEQWTANDAECVIRLTEAGFSPRSFYPLRKRLGRCLRDLLERYVDELHIEVPLSTYAFCIADPYHVLKEDEVHFGFSNNWRDGEGQFEDNLLDGIDVLVGRLPAHLPSDIQRRRAVWKPELRHFKDVIVFPSVGKVPLAHMLSGGDYDGDTPWICWDQNIVRNFYNTDLPGVEFPPEHFGLTKHSVPMRDIQSKDEFLQSAFTFNLTLSNLGRCTVEHEKIAYDESIDCKKAKELACLLSHLVDGRKGGVHLSEKAWQQYRKRISPRVRELPAYKNPERKHKRTNIIDYLRFDVAREERHRALRQMEEAFPEAETSRSRDEDLVQPWKDARDQAKSDKQESRQLYVALRGMAAAIKRFYDQWSNAIGGGQASFSPLALEAAEEARAIPPPEGDHPLIHAWQHCRDEWLRVLASYTYQQHPHSSFVIHAFGETLCQIKTSTRPARSVTNEILACYRVNQKVIKQLTARDAEEEDDTNGEDEYEGHEAIEAMLFGLRPSAGYFDPDDGMSVE